MEALLGSKGDIDAWMALVAAVAWNFPGLETPADLEEHRRTVLRFMDRGQALCVKSGETLVGVLLFSRKRNMICCLAVDPACRRQGAARALVAAALASLDRSAPITVSTFRQGDPKGQAPRGLYRAFGFREGPLTEACGYPQQELFLPPSPTEGG